MHLAICSCPQEPLEDAPRTALLEEWRWNSGGDETWDGFWSEASDEYYVRCTSRDGTTQWFRLEDEIAPAGASEQGDLPLSVSTRKRVSLVVAQSPSGRRMLVGSARRNGR